MQHLKTLIKFIIQESIENNQISHIAGPNYGHILYPLAHALSPTGYLTSDRNEQDVSPAASLAWQKRFNKSQDNLLPFDDINAHNKDLTPKYNHPNHTDDTSDDCKILPNKPHLNAAYPPLGNEISLLNTLSNNHTNTLNSIPTRLHNTILSLLDKSAQKLTKTWLTNH